MTLQLANYHPKLREGVLGDVPETAGDKAFLADGTLSEIEIAALDRAQSVFGMETFYRAWELDALTPSEVHAVLYMLTFYDPYTTVHDVTADPDDTEAEGAELTRALDDFGVYPGACLYCTKESEPIAMSDVLRRMTLQHLAHHAKVQADALSPCDLRDFTEEELIALGFVESPVHPPYSAPLYQSDMISRSFTASVRLTDELLKFEKDFPRDRGTSKVLIQSGEILSPFTHAMRAAGGPPSARGLEPCLEAVKRIVDWDAKRYVHFVGYGQALLSYLDVIFPDRSRRYKFSLGALYPTWAWFLVDQSAGQDKPLRLMNQFRALNLPAIRQHWGALFDKTAVDASSALRGEGGVLLPAWDLYLHRNIGFSTSDYQADIDTRIRGFPLPERCGLKRLRPGTFKAATRVREGTLREYYFWKRESGLSPDLYWNSGMSFWNRESRRMRDESGKNVWHLILEYSCE